MPHGYATQHETMLVETYVRGSLTGLGHQDQIMAIKILNQPIPDRKARHWIAKWFGEKEIV